MSNLDRDFSQREQSLPAPAELANASSESVQDPTPDNSPRKSIVRRKKRLNWYVLSLAMALLVSWAIYTFAWPTIEQAIRLKLYPRSKFEETLRSPMREIYQTCEFLAVVWFFYLGASIGSFFNIIAGRIPAGRGIVFGGSKCPYCDTRLSFRDNIPILGWLSCKGRCSTCKLPISTRYLLMEVLVGALFVLLAGAELFSGGKNLPNFSSLIYAGVIWTVFYPKWYLIQIFAYHAMFFAVLVLLAAASREKNRFPWSATWFAAVVFGILKFANPNLQFVRWFDMLWTNIPAPNVHVEVGLTIATGILAGLLAGFLTARMLPSPSSDQERRQWHQCFLMVGVVLGWQAVLLTSLVALLSAWMYAIARRSTWKVSTSFIFAILITTVFVHHMFWRQIVSMISSRLA